LVEFELFSEEVVEELELLSLPEVVPPGEVALLWLVLVTLLVLPELVLVGSVELPVPPSFWLHPTNPSAAQKTRINFFIVDFLDARLTISVSIQGRRPKVENNAVKPCFPSW
jgi:hypothetical protein